MSDSTIDTANTTEEPSPATPPKIYHPTPAERVARGKAARSQVPRESHAAWEPAADRPDPIDLLEAQARDRVPELVPIRYGRMLASSFAFYRGAAAIMASDLAHTPQSGLNAQICGDAHVANFGGFASPERDLIFDINDFDETLPGPWEWDVKRLATSLEIAGRMRECNQRECRAFSMGAASAYRLAMQELAAMPNLDVWYARLDMAGLRRRWGAELKPRELDGIEKRFSRLQTRDNVRSIEKLIDRRGDRVRIASRPPLVVPLEELFPANEREQAVAESMRQFIRQYRQSLPGNIRYLLENFEYVHMARKVVGVGSVGLRAWIVLLTGRDNQDSLFLQFKEAQASVLEQYAGKSHYGGHGRRVVEGQRLMQAASDVFLGWERVQGVDDGLVRDFYVRQLWDWKVSADAETMPMRELLVYGQMCGWTLARAHARSGDRIAIASYLGKGSAFDNAIAAFAQAYADQNERDYRSLRKAVESGRVHAETGT